MIIPIRCFTCGTLIADKYQIFLTELEKKEKKENIDEIFKELKLKRYCCRRMLYTQSNILNKLK